MFVCTRHNQRIWWLVFCDSRLDSWDCFLSLTVVIHQLLKCGSSLGLPELWGTALHLCFLNHVKCFSLEWYGGLSSLHAPTVIAIKKTSQAFLVWNVQLDWRQRTSASVILLGEIYFYMSWERCLRVAMWSCANCSFLKHFPWLWLWVIRPRLHGFCPLDEFHVACLVEITSCCLFWMLVISGKRFPEDVVHWLAQVQPCLYHGWQHVSLDI